MEVDVAEEEGEGFRVRVETGVVVDDLLRKGELDAVDVELVVRLARPERLLVDVEEGERDTRDVTLFAGDAVDVFVVDTELVVVRVDVVVRLAVVDEVDVLDWSWVGVARGDAVGVLEGCELGETRGVGLADIDAAAEKVGLNETNAVRVEVDVRVLERDAVVVSVGRT